MAHRNVEMVLYSDEQFVTNIGRFLDEMIEATGMDDPRPTVQEAIDATDVFVRSLNDDGHWCLDCRAKYEPEDDQ